ncbi:MAG: hypothetical protein HYX63_00020 [Gammaproteobacteria bacterium]|nr:hypothetical protein [Gammaproteobacteria bacterium]
MNEFDLRNEIPDEADIIEIYAMVKPVGSSIEVRYSPDDDRPLTMSAGSRTVIGVPEGRKLYISSSPATDGFKIFVAGWFRDRVEQ